MQENNTIPLNVIDEIHISYELGETFTLINPYNVNQRGWGLNKEIRAKLANSTIKYFMLALDDSKVKKIGGLGEIDIILNSQKNGFSIDYESFPWYWDKETRMGGYTGYNELVSGRIAVLNSGIIYLKYDITSHPKYTEFIKDMISGNWGQISIQYRIGINDLPFVNAYLIG